MARGLGWTGRVQIEWSMRSTLERAKTPGVGLVVGRCVVVALGGSTDTASFIVPNSAAETMPSPSVSAFRMAWLNAALDPGAYPSILNAFSACFLFIAPLELPVCAKVETECAVLKTVCFSRLTGG